MYLQLLHGNKIWEIFPHLFAIYEYDYDTVKIIKPIYIIHIYITSTVKYLVCVLIKYCWKVGKKNEFMLHLQNQLFYVSDWVLNVVPNFPSLFKAETETQWNKVLDCNSVPLYAFDSRFWYRFQMTTNCELIKELR